MIYGNINLPVSVATTPPVIQRALTYLKETDLEALDFGVYEPDRDFSVQVIDLTTREKSDAKAEIHRKKLDIHFSITGEETVYCRVHPTDQPIADDQFADRDIGFYDSMDEEVEFPLQRGDFVVFFPGEIHRPGCRKDQVKRIKKIVVKIAGELV